MQLTIIEHYAKDDKKFEGDYCSIDVLLNQKIVRHYSDHYHDKGLDKARAFCDALLFGYVPDGKEYTGYLDGKPDDRVLVIRKADDKT